MKQEKLAAQQKEVEERLKQTEDEKVQMEERLRLEEEKKKKDSEEQQVSCSEIFWNNSDWFINRVLCSY